MANTYSASLQLADAGFMQPGGAAANATCIITNFGTAVASIIGIQAYLLSNGNPYPGGAVSVPTANPVGVSAVQPNGGQLCFSFGVVVMTPNGSAETGTAQSNVSTQALTLNVTATTSDNVVVNTQMTITPVQLGASQAAAPGQFVFSSPANSPNYIFY